MTTPAPVELLTCPSCGDQRRTGKLLSVADEKSLPCPKCQVKSPLGEWRGANPLITPVSTHAEPTPDFSSLDAAEKKPTNKRDVEKVSRSYGDAMLAMFGILVTIVAGLVAIGCAIGALDSLNVVTQNRFHDDNAVGATANAIESLQTDVMFFKCIFGAVIAVKVASWAVAQVNRK